MNPAMPKRPPAGAVVLVVMVFVIIRAIGGAFSSGNAVWQFPIYGIPTTLPRPTVAV
jgi:hypothetical protein